MIAFTFFAGKLAKSIMLLDGVSGEARTFEDDRLNFSGTYTVVVNKELYAFKEGDPVSSYKIVHYTSTDQLVKTTLSTLPCNDDLKMFSVCYVAGNIILSGGFGICGITAQTYLMDVLTDRWQQKSCADLNQPRNEHSSIGFGD